jgi:hypothetical protein
MDVISAYREVGTYRGAADVCGTTHKCRVSRFPGQVMVWCLT